MSSASEGSRRLLILYGSQTGCAMEVARRIAREALRFHFEPELSSMDAYQRSRLPTERLAVFVASTTGQAEAPHNMQTFWRFLRRKDIPRGSLSHLHFSTFGLGDSSYPVYNAVARRLHQRLIDLGAKPFHPRGLGDDQDQLGYDEKLDPWMNGLWKALERLVPSDKDPLAAGRLLPARYVVTAVTNPSNDLSSGDKDPCIALRDSDLAVLGDTSPRLARLAVNKRVTASDHDQDVRHIVFDFAARRGSETQGADGKGLQAEKGKSASVDFTPGDVLSVYPQNDLKATLDALKLFNIAPDQILEIKANPTAPKFLGTGSTERPALPRRVTALRLFRVYLDIFGTPRRYFFEALAHFARDPMHAEKLKEFASAEGQLELYRYNHREKRTYVEVLSDFRSAKLPIEYLISLVPRIEPRQFSIASSALARPDTAEILMAVVRYKTPFSREKHGLCSNWLASLNPGPRGPCVPVSFSRGSFRMPRDPSVPVVMVGPGTGIAPFRAMCQERQAARRAAAAQDGDATSLSQRFGDIYVFFGNRYAERDFFFRDEWRGMLRDGTIRGFHTAFSRDQDRKVYVQHRLAEQKEAVWRALGQQQGTFMLAGNAQKMPNDVRKQVLAIVSHMGRLDEAQAKRFMLRLDSRRRYVQETWS